ncbi:hypothetical protein RRG08_033345 [Elysia crispata]|uniref:Uncharacterized protein n=1 Tax=Elysia crispata TaxID=231223 RepID=A0AAE1DCD9_9GAST|nr:hypothetical protein RRG08_033345 [Elysia crispata]
MRVRLKSFQQAQIFSPALPVIRSVEERHEEIGCRKRVRELTLPARGGWSQAKSHKPPRGDVRRRTIQLHRVGTYHTRTWLEFTKR